MTRVCVVGAGSLGCLYAARLATTRTAEITLVRRQSGSLIDGFPLDRSQTVGLRLDASLRLLERDGSETKVPVQVANGIGSISRIQKPFDLVFVCVKYNDTKEVGMQLREAANRRVIDHNTVIVSLQNGMGNVEILRDCLKDDVGYNVIHGISYQGAQLLSPLAVSHNGEGQTFLEENHNQEKLTELVGAFNTLPRTKNSPMLFTRNIESSLMTKLLVSTIINPMTAILGCQNGGILDERHNGIIDAAAEEFVKFAQAKKVNLLLENHSAASYTRYVAEKTKKNVSSMLSDIRNQRPTEVEGMNGFVVRNAADLGVSVPVQNSLYHLVKAIESKWKNH